MDPFSVANTNFALDLFKELNTADQSGNIFVSPLSISSALAMVYLGAKGETAIQMATVLHFDTAQDIHSTFQKLNANIHQADIHQYQLKLANCLFGEKTFNFLSDFLESTLKFYRAELTAVDFRNESDKVRQQINAWAEAQTEGKIKDVLAPDAIEEDTKLVLINAIYFKADWMSKFPRVNTHEQPFRMSKNQTKPVQMMNQVSTFKTTYIPEVETVILELPYVQNELSMMIMLPDLKDDNSGLEKLQNGLTFEKLLAWTNPDKMIQNYMEVSLPKFKMDNSYSLGSTLRGMGMVDAFGKKANFSGMTTGKELVLSKVVHKTFVGVDEEGTEAAAVTAMMFNFCSGFIGERFVADHPFLFFIRHNESQNILFFGRFSSP